MTTTSPTATGPSERHRRVAREWIDAFNERDDERERAARTAGFVAHAPDSLGFPALDDAGWIAFLGVFLEGFPDLQLEVQETAADDGTTAQRIRFTGTHTGPFRGLPPTGRRIDFHGIELNRMADGRIAEHWIQMDSLTLFDQLGLKVVPGPRLLARILAAKVGGLAGGRRREPSA